MKLTPCAFVLMFQVTRTVFALSCWTLTILP